MVRPGSFSGSRQLAITSLKGGPEERRREPRVVSSVSLRQLQYGTMKRRVLESFGDMASLSFRLRKVIGTSGMEYTENKEEDRTAERRVTGGMTRVCTVPPWTETRTTRETDLTRTGSTDVPRGGRGSPDVSLQWSHSGRGGREGVPTLKPDKTKQVTGQESRILSRVRSTNY